MKTLIALGVFSLMSAAAHAQICETNSRSLSFPGSTADEAVYRCKASPSTSNAECAANVACRWDFGPNACETNSRGLVFNAQTERETISKCQLHPSTSNAECEANVVCGDDFGRGRGRRDGRGDRGGRDDRWGRGDRGGRDDRWGRDGRDGRDGRGGWQPPRQEPPRQEPPRREPPRQEPPRREPPRREPPRPPAQDAGQCYLNRYPDICQNSPKNYCKDPAKHYREHGQSEGRIWGCQ